MADESQYYGFRARTAQLLTWLFGQRQQVEQQQTQKSDRQVADGYDRGADDPDNRRRQQMQGTPDTGREALQRAAEMTQHADGSRTRGLTPADLHEIAQSRAPRRTTEEHGLTVGDAAREASRSAQTEALRQRIQHQQPQQRGRGKGQGW